MQYGAPNLNELQSAWGLFAQDSWHLKPNLTVNFGLRWDFTGDRPQRHLSWPVAGGHLWTFGIWQHLQSGRAPLSQIRNSSRCLTNTSHVNVSPQPALGIAWSPSMTDGMLEVGVFGETRRPFRAGYSLKRYTESYQNFWSYASNYAPVL